MRPAVGLSDVVRALEVLGARAASSDLGSLLGYTIAPKEAPRTAPRENATTKSVPAVEAEPGRAPFDGLEEPAFIEPLLRPSASPAAPLWWTQTTALEKETPGQAWTTPPLEPLFRPELQRDILERMVSIEAPGRRVDVRALAALLARREPYRTIPRLAAARTSARVAVLVDGSDRMKAFDADVRALVRVLRTIVGKTSVSVTTVDRQSIEAGRERAILVISDFRETGAAVWAAALRATVGARARVTALVPGAVGPSSFVWLAADAVEWSRRTHPTDIGRRRPRAPVVPKAHALLALATRLSAAVRIEPALLRRVRLSLTPDPGPAVEASLRASRMVDVSNALAFTLRRSERAGLMRRLAKRPVDLARAYAAIEAVHAAGAPVLRLEERLTFLALEGAPGWEERAASELRGVTRALSGDRPGLARWLEQAMDRLPEGLRDNEGLGEAATRASAVLGRPLETAAEPRRPPPAVAEFLRGHFAEPFEPFTITVVDLDGTLSVDSVPPSPEEMGRIRNRMYLPVPLFSESATPRIISPFSMSILGRATARERKKAFTTVSVRVANRELNARIGAQLATDGYVLENDPKVADGAVVDFRSREASRLIDRAQRDPGFVLCLVTSHREIVDAATWMKHAEVVDGSDAESVYEAARSVLQFARPASMVRIEVRPRRADASEGGIPLTPTALARLAPSDLAQGEYIAVSPSARERVLHVPRRRLSLSDGANVVLGVRPVPDLWVARLLRATCMVETAPGDMRTACLVGPSRVATIAASKQGADVMARREVIVRFESNETEPGHVESVHGEIAFIALASPRPAFRALHASDEPPALGDALILVRREPMKGSFLVTGRAMVNEGGRTEIVPQSRLSDDQRESMVGAPVLIDGLYAGHVSAHSRRVDSPIQLVPAVGYAAPRPQEEPDDVARRSGDRPEATRDEEIARALVGKGFTFERGGQFEQAMDVYDEVVSQFGTRSDGALAEKVAEALVGKVNACRALASVHPEKFLPVLAMTLNNLGVKTSDLGRRGEALAVTEEAVDRYRSLARARPDAFLPDLAAALTNLGNRLSDVGRREEALAAAEGGVEHYRSLARDRPDTFLPNLATGLSNLGNRLSDVGRHEEALVATQEALEHYRSLARARPDAFLPDLAMSLDHLGARLAALGRHEEALAASQGAVEHYRTLARARSDPFLSGLASSLRSFGTTLAALGRREEALAASEEAVEHRRVLARARPEAFLPSLAGDLNNLGNRLSELARYEEALAAIREAVQHYRILARDRADAFLSDLAAGLNNLGIMLWHLDRREEAVFATEEAVGHYRALARTYPDAFGPIVAVSLDHLGRMLSDVGRHEEARAAADEATEHRQKRTRTSTMTERPHRGATLTTPADVLIVTVTRGEADAVRAVTAGARSSWRAEELPGSSSAIWIAQFEGQGGRSIRIALAQVLQMGGVATVQATAALAEHYNPGCIAICGVCAGRPGSTALGDVVIADRVYRHDAGPFVNEASGSGSRITGDLVTHMLPAQWLAQAQRFAVSNDAPWLKERPILHVTQENWVLRELLADRNPVESADRARRCPDWTDVARSLLESGMVALESGAPRLTDKGRRRAEQHAFEHPDGEPPAQPFRIHVGLLVTLGALVPDVNVWDRLVATYRRVLALDTELSAFGAAALGRDRAWIVVKGVADFAEPGRNQNFRDFAARAAAEVLLGVLRQNLG